MLLFDEFLHLNKIPMVHLLTDSRIKVLLLENIPPVAIEAFKREGFNVEFEEGALDEDELTERIKDVSILGIRSMTYVTKRVIENANILIAIGAFCNVTNQIDLKTCTQQGIEVFYAPYSNTRSVAELVIGEMLMLIRNIIPKSNEMHAGKWDKLVKNSFEVRRKKIGLVGYGHIGTQLSVICEALGMEVYFYDIADKMPIGNAKKCRSLVDVISVADVLSIQIDGCMGNSNIITKKHFKQMKNGIIFLNHSSGNVVDVPALVQAIKEKKVGGAGIDVFPIEPKSNDEGFVSELRGLPNVILTPHIGGNTEEAQESIGNYVSECLIECIKINV